MRTVAVTFLLALSLCQTAHAQSADALARARTHFEAGRALYNLGNYTDAIREFSAGYELVPKPEFLLNLGLCYRKQEDFEKAREMYKKFLAEAPANDPERGKAQQRLAEIEKLIKERPAAPPRVTPPPTETQPVVRQNAAPPENNRVLQNAAPPRTDLVLHQPPPERKKRAAWIIPVAVTASVIVVAGIAVGVYFGTRPASCPASLGCITVGP